MAQEALTTELLSMRKQAERMTQSIDQISRNLSAERRSLWQTVEEYNAKRIELFKQELRARGMTWCTYCSDEVISESEAKFLLVKGSEKYPQKNGYPDRLRDFSKIHRVCPACREYAAGKHGWEDSYRYGIISFYAFHVEKREDGYYVRWSVDWEKIDDEEYSFDERISRRLVEKLAMEWDLPPRVEIVSDESVSKQRLVVHERTATAEAN